MLICDTLISYKLAVKNLSLSQICFAVAMGNICISTINVAFQICLLFTCLRKHIYLLKRYITFIMVRRAFVAIEGKIFCSTRHFFLSWSICFCKYIVVNKIIYIWLHWILIEMVKLLIQHLIPSFFLYQDVNKTFKIE